MQAIHLTDHAIQRAAERGMPPFVLRNAARTATFRGHGNCAVVTKYGTVVVHHDTVLTVLTPQQRPHGNLQRVYLR